MSHIAAIHVLKSQLKLSDDDYRYHLKNWVGVDSCKGMNASQLLTVRKRMEQLATVNGIAQIAVVGRKGWLSSADFAKKKMAASSGERYCMVLWRKLHEAGKVGSTNIAALDAYVKRLHQVDALRFCTGAQINTTINTLKQWLARGANPDAGGRDE